MVTEGHTEQAPVREVVATSTTSEDPLLGVATALLGSDAGRVVDLVEVLSGTVTPPVDVVRAGDDLLPRLAHENTLGHALGAARAVIRPGGLIVAAVPELSRLGRLRPTAPPPRVTGRGDDRQVTVQLWDWAEDGCSYELDVVQLVRRAGAWELTTAVSTRHRVLTPEEISAELYGAGFTAVRRLRPVESGHPLPVWVAVVPLVPGAPGAQGAPGARGTSL